MKHHEHHLPYSSTSTIIDPIAAKPVRNSATVAGADKRY